MIEWQVSNLELSKQLAKLGSKQESLFWWYSHPESDSFFVEKAGYSSDDGMSVPICSAFTTAELGEMLPFSIDHKNTFANMKVQPLGVHGKPKIKINWWIKYVSLGNDETVCEEYADTEADVRAKMLIYLTKNKRIEILK